MRVDFYQLGAAPLEQVIASIAEKLLGEEQRLLIVAEDEACWPGSTGSCGTRGRQLPAARPRRRRRRRAPADPAVDQPDAPNLARNMLIADGEWREAALGFDRAFYLFDERRWKARGWPGSCWRAATASSATTGRRTRTGDWVEEGLSLAARPRRAARRCGQFQSP